MTRIVYSIKNGFYECTELSSEKGEGGIIIVCPKGTMGEISLKGARKKLENSVAEFDTPPVDNQIIEPILHKGRKNIPLERIYLSSGVALTLPKSDGYVRALAALVEKQQKTIEELSVRLDKLDSAVFGTRFFQKGKNMKRKITLILVFILAICLVFSVNVSAYNENESEEITESAGEEISSSDTYEENENFFTVLYEGVKANADKILSALAFLGSLLIAFAYKRGLFPFVEKALTSLSGAVVKLGNETKKNAESENEFLSALSEKLKTTEDILLGFTESLKKLEAELASFSEEKGERENLKLIMATEVDMLNEIILASSLPQYQKERAGECFMKMKAKLNTEVSGDESEN